MFIDIFSGFCLAPNLVQNSYKISKLYSYVQEVYKYQYTSYLNKIEQYYKKT